MAELSPKGSIIFKIIILLLAVVVIASILVPQSEWKRKAKEQEQCRQNMENIFYTSLQYLKEYKRFESGLDSLMAFARHDSMIVYSGTFEVERLTVWGSPSDSFLVTFNDLFHYEKIDWEYLPKDSARPGAKSPDSVYLYLTPRPRFKHAPVSRFRFYSDDSIFVQRRKKSADDISVVVWGKSRIPNEWAPSDSLVMPVKDFAISEDPENIRICPSCGESYKIDANVRLKLKGEINFKVLRKNEGNIAENEFLRMQFFNKLYSDAAIAAVNTINADTAMFIKSENQAKELIFGAVPPDTVILTPSDSSKIAAIRDSVLTTVRDSLTAKNLQSALDKMKPNSTLQLAEESPRVVTTDSVQAWDNPERIKALLFPAQISDKAARLAENEKVQALTMQLLAQESYIIASIDTIGITITCPIVSFYDPPQKTFLQKIFGVGPVENHGRIKNSDYSWSEKK